MFELVWICPGNPWGPEVIEEADTEEEAEELAEEYAMAYGGQVVIREVEE